MKLSSESSKRGPLAGLRVVELGRRVATAFAGRLLADLGAAVIRVGGGDWPGPLSEALKRSLDLNKVSVEADSEELAELGAWCDVVLATSEAEEAILEALLREPIQGRVLVHLNDFGVEGPRSHWRGTELLAVAYGGACQMNGEPGRAPLRPPPFVGEHEVGLNLAIGALLATLAARRDGLGQHVEVSSVDTWATIQTAIGTLEYIFQGRVALRAGRRFGGRAYPYTMLPCADGDIRLICLQGREWARSLEMMGSPAWGKEPRFADRLINQRDHADELDDLISAWLAERTKDELLAEAIKFRVPWVPVRVVKEVLREPQLLHRGFFWSDEDLQLPGYPAKFSRTPLWPASPNQRIPSCLPARSQIRDEPLTPVPPHAIPPLAGLRVIDFGWAWAGGVVGSLLADFGADVIKIESRRRLDPMRMDRPLLPEGDSIEQSSLHHNVNRNKRSVAIDVTTVEGAELIRHLACKSDVLVENFSPGALAKHGLSPAELGKVNPRLIYISLGAVGSSGPLTGIRAYAPVLTALAGMDALVNYPGEPPMGLQHGLADPNAGLFAVLSCLAALLERAESNLGQHVDLSQLEALVSLLGVQLAVEQLDPGSVVAAGNRDPQMSPHGIFRSSGEDRWVAIACPDDNAWRALVTAMGSPEWAEKPDLETFEGRRRRETELEDLITEWTETLSPLEAAERIQEAGGYAAPLQDTADRFLDEHLQSRNTYVPVEHPIVGTEYVYGVPIHLSRTPGQVRSATPLLGEHTDVVLREVLGMKEGEIEELRDRGVLT